ncbi:MAG: hypothetical protein ABIK97_00290 [candidate division WOR-3 bacterium]
MCNRADKVFLLTYAFWILSLFSYTGDFEDLGSSAKAMGKGSAAVSCLLDAGTIYYNPAFTSFFSKRELTFLHSENFGGIFRNDYLGFIYPFANYAVGLGIYANFVPGVKITKLLNETLPPSPENPVIVERIVTTYDGIFYLNYAHRLLPGENELSLGVNGKIFYRSLGLENAFGFGADLGIGFKRKDLALGLRLRNLFASPLLWSDTTEYVKMRGTIGITKVSRLFGNDFSLSYEIEGNLENLPFYANFGLEYTWRFFSLRVGLLRRSPTFGFGIVYKNLYCDYAYERSRYPEPESRELPPSPIKISGGVRF